MGPPARSWFLAPRAPRFNYSPGGYIGLGSILKDPFYLDKPITYKGPAPFPDTIRIKPSSFTNWEEYRERVKKGQFRV